MEENMTFNGMKILNFRCYFENLEYVEEFDTEDGRHWEGRAHWTNGRMIFIRRLSDADMLISV